MPQKLLTRSVQQLGPGTVGTSLPKELIEFFEVETGDELRYDYDIDAGTITFHLRDEASE